jgi:hypothetical protein
MVNGVGLALLAFGTVAFRLHSDSKRGAVLSKKSFDLE